MPGKALNKTIRLERSKGARNSIATILKKENDKAFAELGEIKKPKTRLDCKNIERPCPWVGCKHHLYLDVHPTRHYIILNFPDIEPWELHPSCTLDIVDEFDGLVLETIGRIMNLTRERARQIEKQGLFKLGKNKTLILEWKNKG
jgi:hypothetical protein